MSSGGHRGYYGLSSHERYMAHNEQSTIHKMKETYWTTKQAVMKKLGKKEDEHIVASDSQLDAKLEVFKAIQKSCMDLLKNIEKYQDRLCTLSQEENSMGRFLKGQSQTDKTRAGKMMAAVGKSLSFSSQQRLALRVPLVRLYQEVETFRYRAISDTLMTINRMESARTEYRGALLWMKDVSDVLDPDTYKQLEKFRKVQAQVRKTKARFDKLKLDTMQKIDLLAASRCNMFSHVLANYQSTLLHFWDKTSRTMSTVADSFKGYQHYEFNMLKELAEPSKRLASDSNIEAAEREMDGYIDKDGEEEDDSSEMSEDDDSTSGNDEENHTKSKQTHYPQHRPVRPSIDDLLSLNFDDIPRKDYNSSRLVQLGHEAREDSQDSTDNGSMSNLLEAIDREIAKPSGKQGGQMAGADILMDFGDGEDALEEIKKKQDEELDISGRLIQSAAEQDRKNKKKMKNVPQDLLTENYEVDDTEKDDLTLLNDILNAPSTGGDDFSREWHAVFGSTPMSNNMNLTPVESDKSGAEFMPSNLLDMKMGQMSLHATGAIGESPASQAAGGPAAKQSAPKAEGKAKKGQKTDMSAWFNLFADLDPLSNPDAIGRKKDECLEA